MSMAVRSVHWLTRLGTAALLLIVTVLLLSQFLGQPLLLGYVETGSMRPTMEPGDGFVAVPSALAGPIESGDIVVFRAEQLGGGGPTTHRVVGRTEQGYLTKGDANGVIDQQSGEPPVDRTQVVAEALQIGGRVVVIPNLGDAVTTVSSLVSTAVFGLSTATGLGLSVTPKTVGLGFVLLAILDKLVEWSRSGASRSRTRLRTRSRDTGSGYDIVLIGLTVILLVGVTAPMVVPAGATEYGFITSNAETTTVVPPASTQTADYRTGNGGPIPVYVLLSTSNPGSDVAPDVAHLDGGEETMATLTVRLPRRIGYHQYYVVEHRYLAVLPRPVLIALHGVHPWLPVVVIDALVGGAFYATGTVLLGSGSVRSRSRGGSSTTHRLLNRYL